MSIIIIGAGGAGISAAQTIRAIDKTIPVTMISAEKNLPYSPCALPYYLSTELPARQMPRFDRDYFEKNKIKMFAGSPVCRIVPDEKTVVLTNGRSFKYEKLLISAGSVPVIPPIEGIDKQGVFFLDTMASSKRIMDFIRKKKAKKAIIIGAGFTGIESAFSLQAHKVKVVVVEMLARVLGRILDEDMAQPVTEMIKQKDIELKLGEEVSKITGEKYASGVRLKNKDLVTGDLIIVGIGVKPNIQLLTASGIKLNRGIAVDEYMKTSDENIYAAGDIAETNDFISGASTLSPIWPNAIEQGRVAALNMLGVQTGYEGPVSVNILNIDGCPVVGMGQMFADAKKDGTEKLEEIKYNTEKSRRKLILRDNKVIGFQSVGYFRYSGLVWSYLKKREDISKIKDKLLKDNFNPRG